MKDEELHGPDPLDGLETIPGTRTRSPTPLADCIEMMFDNDNAWIAGTVRAFRFRIRELAAERNEERGRNADLEAALDSEKRQHDETRGYRQMAEEALTTTHATLHAALPNVPDNCTTENLAISVCAFLEEYRRRYGSV